ncbi:MAG: efflux RND transporter periplasmic adaptor subunit [Gammaproteobacteria bacterium]|nr:efflux RND transporter periplasmic adaptor subunit [Gammaproteobacteria bacterium]
MNAHRLALLAPSIVAAAVLAGCEAPDAAQAPAEPPAPAVTTAEVLVRDLADWADFTGRLEAAQMVAVRPRVAGYVESVHFEEGGRVEAGDLLFQIDPRPYQAEVDRLEAERERARAEVEVARSNRERAERLLAENATSREEFERMSADAQVAEAALASIEAALEAAELDLSFTRVTAPIAGRVSRAIVTAGNLVDSSTLLTSVVGDDTIYAYFDVDEQTYLKLIDGPGPSNGAAYVGLANEKGYPHAARLDFVDNQVDPAQGTIRARAVLDNADGSLTPGLFARVRVVGKDRYRAALIDERAIGTDLDRKYVLVVDDAGVAEYRAVELGRAIDHLRIVTAGLRPGDDVIVNGLQRVRPGMPVEPTKVAAERDVPALERFAAVGAVERKATSSTSW